MGYNLLSSATFFYLYVYHCVWYGTVEPIIRTGINTHQKQRRVEVQGSELPDTQKKVIHLPGEHENQVIQHGKGLCMGSIIIDGKQYRRFAGYREKSAALKVAASHRNGGWNARVIKEGESYSLYLRKKLR